MQSTIIPILMLKIIKQQQNRPQTHYINFRICGHKEKEKFNMKWVKLFLMTEIRSHWRHFLNVGTEWLQIDVSDPGDGMDTMLAFLDCVS